MAISLLMLNWKREQNLHKILGWVDASQLITEVLVWNNNPDTHFEYPKCRIINSNEDFGMRTRFALGLFAENDCVLLYDDDMILAPSAIEGLYEQWKEDPEIMHGLFGRFPNDDGTYGIPVEQQEAEVEMVIGRTMMFHRKYCAGFFTIERDFLCHEGASTKGASEDLLMSYYIMSQTDRLNRVHEYNVIELSHEHSFCDRPGHAPERDYMLHECRTRLMPKELK